MAAQSPEIAHSVQDTTGTPFKKGIWLTGIAGSISSGTALTDTTAQRIYNNSYGINLSTGRFFKDRWAAGMIFTASRQSNKQFVVRESESLFIGPLVQHYLSESETGSIFFTFSPGFSSFRERIELERNGITQERKASGSGFGILAGIGYSYVMHRRIAFDLRLNISNAWINATSEIQPAGSTTTENIQIGDISFSFGFNVLLDSFFF